MYKGEYATNSTKIATWIKNHFSVEKIKVRLKWLSKHAEWWLTHLENDKNLWNHHFWMDLVRINFWNKIKLQNYNTVYDLTDSKYE